MCEENNAQRQLVRAILLRGEPQFGSLVTLKAHWDAADEATRDKFMEYSGCFPSPRG